MNTRRSGRPGATQGQQKARNTPPRISPWSSGQTVLKADYRTREGKFVREVDRQLREHVAGVGGTPSIAEQLLIQATVVVAARIAFMGSRIMSDTSKESGYDTTFLAWANTLRRNLETLGIKSIGPKLPALADYLTGKGVKP